MSQGRSILLAVRVGEASVGPARTAAWLAAELGARVTVLYVATELGMATEVAAGGGLKEEAVREQMEREARERTDAMAAAALRGAPYEVVISEGEVAEEVARAAERVNADLVVVGSQGRGAIQGMILGDTTRDILRRSPCPVVVVPPGVAEKPPGGAQEPRGAATE